MRSKKRDSTLPKKQPAQLILRGPTVGQSASVFVSDCPASPRKFSI
jgi:hypothetical protein